MVFIYYQLWYYVSQIFGSRQTHRAGLTFDNPYFTIEWTEDRWRGKGRRVVYAFASLPNANTMCTYIYIVSFPSLYQSNFPVL